MNIIEIENLSKKYLISRGAPAYSDSLKEILSHGMKKMIGCKSERSHSPMEEFWALKNVHVNIQQGDRVALLGRNGAGKSTLLKILSRITEPSHGKITIRGRIASLLEVGTGFHPDLTGRENIILNGVIMGMGYKEIKSKFDEIVAFAEIEKFLDTPIKRYSSGMFMRLGFAIAAHLDSDIIIVDEVLAVGDARFQEKCLKKMNEIGSQNRTILFVSHSVNSVLALCDKGIFLEKGEIRSFGPVEECVSHYMQCCPMAGFKWEGNLGDEHIRIQEASLRAPTGNQSFFYQGEQTFLDIHFEMLKSHPDLLLGFSVLNSRNQTIAKSRLGDHESYQDVLKSRGEKKVSFELNLDLFHPGEYHIKLDCSLRNQKKILNDEVLLKFAVCSLNKILLHEQGIEREGISLGNRWLIS